MISVIIPVYNTERFLDRCIGSILSQSYHDFELILVDDGSSDNSGEKCDEYALKDPRIKVIHKNNEGPSVARNAGSLASSGDYITFIDSDDFVDFDYLEILQRSLDANDTDISAVLMTEIDDGQEPKYDRCDFSTFVLSGYDALLNVLYQKDLDTTPCGMLFKRSLVIDNPFPAGRYHEDDFTTFKYFEAAGSVAVNKCVKYYYVQHISSIMHSGSSKIIRDEIDAADNLVRYFKEKDDTLLKAAKSKKFSNYCQIVMNSRSAETCGKDEYDSIIKYLKEERKNVLSDKNTRFKNKVAALILCFGSGALKLAGRLVG